MNLNNQLIEYWYTIQEYLNKPTDYAIALEGAESMGKTYFMKDILPINLDINAPYHTYKPVYISLLAVKSIEQLQQKIKDAILPLSQKYFLSIAKNDTYRFQKGLSIFSGFGFNPLEQFAALEDIRTETAKMEAAFETDFDILVLCFDDLEKRYPYFELLDFLGLVNELVHNNVKVVVASNPIEMPEFENPVTDKIYNKLFPFQLNFQAFEEDFYQSIILNSYSDENVEFGDYLLRYQRNILNVLNSLSTIVPMTIFKMLLSKLERLYPYLEAYCESNAEAQNYYEDLLEVLTSLLMHRFLGKEFDANFMASIDMELHINFFEVIIINLSTEAEKEELIYDLFDQILEQIKAGFKLDFLTDEIA